MEEALKAFGDDTVVQVIAGLVALDVLLGVLAAIVNEAQSFKFSYLVDFLRNDVLGKLVPFAGIWIVTYFAGDFEIGGVNGIQDAVAVGIVAALGASVLNSLRDLGLWKSAPDVIAGPDFGTSG